VTRAPPPEDYVGLGVTGAPTLDVGDWPFTGVVSRPYIISGVGPFSNVRGWFITGDGVFINVRDWFITGRRPFIAGLL
jgi:hypothetical protein